MKNVLVANPKGGSGKTTLATNLAGFFAVQGHQVVLADLDRQQSAAEWLKRRPTKSAVIQAFNAKSKYAYPPEWMITDSPGGIRDEKLSEAVKQADFVIVPVQPSAFDIGATQDFLDVLIEEKAVRKQKTFVALVGMRINSRSHSTAKLIKFMDQSSFPVLTSLRNAQVYISAAEQGLSIFDMRPSLVTQDLEQWSHLLNWMMDAASNRDS